ncbi:RNA replicase (plasmid) [Sarcina sp. JB2]|uniref:RNA replicase n=1 Tax=Candidatus Sarcina troglodytae TaxID=2726954 RepID=A0ACD1BH37_9CLOT|nr:RNA replicase [Sarcina sp. JB2]
MLVADAFFFAKMKGREIKMGNNNGRFRKKKIYFTQVSNQALRNEEMSLKAKGLYALIQSYITIEDFTLYKTTLRKQCLEGESAFESAWKELKRFGYLIQYKIQDEKGKFYYEYELLDEPQIEETSQSIHPPKNHPVDNPTGGKSTLGKVGVYNNTNNTNTDFNNTNTNNTTQCQQQVACSSSDVEIKDSPSIVNLIENNTHLILTNNQIKKVSSWDIIRLRKSIEIFREQQGQYFALLEKIYLDNGNFAPKTNKQVTTTYNNNKTSTFANFTQRKYDYDKLEKQLLGWADSDDDCEI